MIKIKIIENFPTQSTMDVSAKKNNYVLRMFPIVILHFQENVCVSNETTVFLIMCCCLFPICYVYH